MREDKQKTEDKELDDFADERDKTKTMAAEEEADLITEKMIKKVTYLIHKLADQREQEYKVVQDKCKKQFSYTNLAQVTLLGGHAIITKLIELTGGEEPEPQLPTKPDDGFKKPDNKKMVKEKESSLLNISEMKELETKIGKLAMKLQICVRKSHEIVEDEIGKENITEGTRATLVKSFAATLFIEASRRGVGR